MMSVGRCSIRSQGIRLDQSELAFEKQQSQVDGMINNKIKLCAELERSHKAISFFLQIEYTCLFFQTFPTQEPGGCCVLMQLSQKSTFFLFLFGAVARKSIVIVTTINTLDALTTDKEKKKKKMYVNPPPPPAFLESLNSFSFTFYPPPLTAYSNLQSPHLTSDVKL
jgi:hypothetical protein